MQRFHVDPLPKTTLLARQLPELGPNHPGVHRAEVRHRDCIHLLYLHLRDVQGLPRTLCHLALDLGATWVLGWSRWSAALEEVVLVSVVSLLFVLVVAVFRFFARAAALEGGGLGWSVVSCLACLCPSRVASSFGYFVPGGHPNPPPNRPGRVLTIVPTMTLFHRAV